MNNPLPKRDVHKDAVLVLGMHRSGTSMLAGILDCLGCKGPRTRPDPSDGNPKGYFESRPIFQLNDEILEAAGTRWDDWQPMREGWFLSSRFNEFRERGAELIASEYDGASLIYLKDPRMCRLLPLWQTVFADMGYRVACIHTHRHPVDVATSLKLRESVEVEPSLGMLSWLRHTLEAEQASRGLPRIFTSYARLLHDWRGFARGAEEIFGFAWPAMTRGAQERVVRLVEPGLRHHQADIDLFMRDPLVPELFQETLRILENWAGRGEQEEDRAVMNRLLRDFDLAAPLLYGPVNALEFSVGEAKQMRSHKAMAEARQTEIDTLSGVLDEMVGERDQLILQRDQLRSAVKDATAVAEARQAEINALSGVLDEMVGERDQLILQRDQLRSAVEDATAVAEARQTEIDALSDVLDETRSERSQLISQREQLRAELAHNCAEIDDAKAEAKARQIEIKALMDQLAGAASVHDQLALERQLLRDELVQARSEIEEARAEAEAHQSKIAALIDQFAEQRASLRSQVDDASSRADALFAQLQGTRTRAEVQQEWLRQTYAVLECRRWWWWLMPKSWVTRRQHVRLHRRGLFDARRYLELYPDVAAGGTDPVRHYIAHGMAEGRMAI